MMRITALWICFFLIGCEPNKFEKWNEIKNTVSQQSNEIDELNDLVKNLNGQIADLDKKIKSIPKENSQKISYYSKLFTIPLLPQMDKINVLKLINKKTGMYEVEVVSLEDIKYKHINETIDFQLTLRSELIEGAYPIRGLVSYYQYSTPEKGIINSESTSLMVNEKNPHIFLDGNKRYNLSGKLTLKVSGKF
jgi:hypothetical protein